MLNITWYISKKSWDDQLLRFIGEKLKRKYMYTWNGSVLRVFKKGCSKEVYKKSFGERNIKEFKKSRKRLEVVLPQKLVRKSMKR